MFNIAAITFKYSDAAMMFIKQMLHPKNRLAHPFLVCNVEKNVLSLLISPELIFDDPKSYVSSTDLEMKSELKTNSFFRSIHNLR